MKTARVLSAAEAALSTASWWYTLAHATQPAKALALSGATLDGLVAHLESRSLPVAPALRQHARLRRQSALAPEGLRYLWAFRSLRDALQVARMNRYSNYRAYPDPGSLREASLDRLYRRFPLGEFPETTILLISGSFVCADPLLGPHPPPNSLANAAPDAIAPEDWDQFTLCDLALGASLISVLPSDRWLRIPPPAVEDAWITATHQLQTHGSAPTSHTVERAAVALLMSKLSDTTFSYVNAATRGSHRPVAPLADGYSDEPADAHYPPNSSFEQGA